MKFTENITIKTFQRSTSFPKFSDQSSKNKSELYRTTYLESKTKLKLGKEESPKILKAIRRHSEKIRGENSKSDVIILYKDEGRIIQQDPSSSVTPKTLVHTSKSDQTISSNQQEIHSTENPKLLAKLLPTRKRRTPHRRLIRRESFNVNIFQDQQIFDSLPKNTLRCSKKINHVLRHMAHFVNEKEDNRVFPFQSTPSGNLKVIPDQVVFETKKVSVLVAEPRHAKVNVKTELNKPKIGESEQPTDLPPGVTRSAIDYLQRQRKLPIIPTQYVPKTQPQRSKLRQTNQMEVKQSSQVGNHRHQPGNEVPLASLGFTVEQPIDWENINLPEKTDLYEELSRRITNYKNADCIVHVGHDEFHCHLLVLQSYSSLFDDKNYKEIDLTGSSVTSRAFSIIYDWMISSSNESCHLLRRDNILEIFTAAQVLGIKELEEQCWAFIENTELFSEDTAFLLYQEAKKIGNMTIMELMIPRIMKFFLMLVSTKDFLELSVDELCLLLKSNYICVNSEMEVLMSAVRWLMYDWETRKENLLDVLKCVRFGLIAPWQLVDVKRNPENPEFMELMSYPEVQKMVDDGLAFVVIKYWYGNQTEDYYHWIELLGLTEPANRNWAGEEKHYVTYREFLLYLEEYQRTKITELKTKCIDKSPTLSNECTESPKRNQINYQNPQTNIKSSSSGQVNLPAHNTGRSLKCPRIPVSRQSPHGVPPNIGMPPEILSKYLSSLGSHSKMAIPQPRDQLNDVRYDQWKSNAGLNWKKLHQRKKENYIVTENSTDSCRSEEQAATTIQAIYRGYKTRRKIREVNQNTRGINQLPLFLPINNNNNSYQPLESLKLSEAVGDPKLLNAEIPQPTPRTKRLSRDRDQIQTIHPPNLLKFPDKMSSVSQFYETDTDDSSFSPTIKTSKVKNQGETVLVFGGIDPHAEYGIPGNAGKDIYRYKSLENVWEFIGEMPEPRHHHSVAYLRGRVYLIGGANPNEDSNRENLVVATVWSYNIETRIWFNEPSLLTPRKNFGLVVINEKIYAIGGQDKNGIALKSVEVFEPSQGHWKRAPSMHTARIGPACVEYGCYIWVAGGITISRRESVSTDVECYDPSKNIWINIEPLRVPRCFASFNVMFDTLYLIGGAGKSLKNLSMTESIDSIDVWNSELRTWHEFAKLGTARHSHSTSSIGNQLLIIGGVTTILMRALKKVECYCFARSSWINGVAPLPYPISGHSSISIIPENYLKNKIK